MKEFKIKFRAIIALSIIINAWPAVSWIGEKNWGDIPQQVVQQILDMPKEQEIVVLDMGCGKGDFVEYIAQALTTQNDDHRIRFILNDMEQSNLQEAEEKLRKLQNDKIAFEFTPSEHINTFLKRSNRSFNIVTSLNVLHFMTPLEALECITQTNSRLIDGGIFAVVQLDKSRKFSDDTPYMTEVKNLQAQGSLFPYYYTTRLNAITDAVADNESPVALNKIIKTKPAAKQKNEAAKFVESAIDGVAKTILDSRASWQNKADMLSTNNLLEKTGFSVLSQSEFKNGELTPFISLVTKKERTLNATEIGMNQKAARLDAYRGDSQRKDSIFYKVDTRRGKSDLSNYKDEDNISPRTDGVFIYPNLFFSKTNDVQPFLENIQGLKK